jgi:uncharacterized membrane protein YbhN (UPF0104 family)
MEVFAVLKTIDIKWYLIAIGLLFLATFLATLRWRLIMELLGFHHHLSFFVKSYLKGCFFNQFLPSSIGGDAYRIIELGTHSDYGKKQAFYGIFVDRVYGYIGLMCLNLLANFYKMIPLPHSLVVSVNILIFSGLLGFIILVNFHRFDFLPHLPGMAFIRGLSKATHNSFSNYSDLSFKFLLAVSSGFISVLSVYCIGLSLHLPYPFIDYLLIIPLVTLVLLLPISMAGWGLREGAMVGLFALNGASKPAIMSLSLLFGLSLLIQGLPGCYLWLRPSQDTKQKR